MNSPEKNKPSEDKTQNTESKKKDSINSEIEELMHDIDMRNEALKKIFRYFERNRKDEKNS